MKGLICHLSQSQNFYLPLTYSSKLTLRLKNSVSTTGDIVQKSNETEHCLLLGANLSQEFFWLGFFFSHHCKTSSHEAYTVKKKRVWRNTKQIFTKNYLKNSWIVYQYLYNTDKVMLCDSCNIFNQLFLASKVALRRNKTDDFFVLLFAITAANL